ncbi:MAG: C4-dicarboxylate ABC transporter substrate-binding protein [Rhodobacteraceae bacterium]|nr:C4-dicarboxylate ABC transporter substrate-binding protein [Paracoccaceae bacterium]
MTRLSRRTAIFALTAAGLAAAAFPAAAQDTNLRVHTGAPGSSSFVFSTTMQTVVQQNTPYRMNMTSGMTSTRSTLDAARGDVDFYISAPAINHYMSNGIAMYKDMADAPELFKNVRSVVNFPLGPYHIITYAGSGIETLEDIRGKRVFLGPPGGAATTVGLAIMDSAGMKPGADFEQAKLDWTSGSQAFQDRRVDVAIIPTELPSPSIQQFALLDEIRLISIPLENFDKGDLKKMVAIPGRTIEEIPADIYGANQVNETPARAVGSWVGIGTRKDLSEDAVYAVTKAIFDHLDTFHGAAEWMKTFTPESALKQMNAPLHPGALRYYREIGVEVPASAIPPEGM